MVTTRVDLTKNHEDGRYGQDIDIIGVHTMEAQELLQTAENVAAYFKKVKASAHWCVDADSRVRVVNDDDTAWTLPGANTRSLNLELAGFAKQTAADWADDYSIKMLEIAALCAAEWVIKYKIPVRKLTDAQIRSGEKGFAGHVDVNRVYKKSSHWDPGPAFPWAYFLGRVNAQVKALGGKVGNIPVVPQAPSKGYDNAGFSTEYIRERQAELKALGYYTKDIDGMRGPGTIDAVKRFQKDMGLDQDGLPGPKTKARLQERLNAAKTSPNPKPAGRPNCTQLQRAVRATPDNSWGPDTDKRLDALRASSAWGGQKFPSGVKFLQGVVGTPQDGRWGPKSVRAHDDCVGGVQEALKAMGYDAGPTDKKWGPTTEAAYQAARRACRV